VSELQRKRPIFSALTLSLIKSYVAEGLGAKEIADRIGCKVGTLRVKCSQNRISLRRSIPPPGSSNANRPRRLVIPLHEEAVRDLEREAAKHGMSCVNLVAALLGAIVRDNLYRAVIDHDVKPTRRGTRPLTSQQDD
jgi:hypothetical protein